MMKVINGPILSLLETNPPIKSSANHKKGPLAFFFFGESQLSLSIHFMIEPFAPYSASSHSDAY